MTKTILATVSLFCFCTMLNPTKAQTISISSDNPMSCFIGDWENNRAIQLITNNCDSHGVIKFVTYLYKDDTLKIEIDDDSMALPLYSLQANDTFYPEHFFNVENCTFHDRFDDYLFENGTGRLPAGDYKFLIELYYSPGVLLVKDSINFSIDTFQAPGCVSPYNNSLIDYGIGNQVIFEWYPTLPTLSFAPTYDLTIKEVLNGQGIYTAWVNNIPVFNTQTANTFYNDPLGFVGMNLLPSKKYVWGITSLDGNGNPFGSNYGVSELYEFTTTTNVADSDILLFQNNQGCLPHGFEQGHMNGYYAFLADHDNVFGNRPSADDPDGIRNITGIPLLWQDTLTGAPNLTDPFVAISTIAPNGGSHSSKHGNSGPSAEANMFAFKATVRDIDTLLHVSYATVMYEPAENIDTAKSFYRFKVQRQRYASHWDIVHFDKFIPDTSLDVFNKNGGYLYQDWNCLRYDLSKRRGQTMWLESTSSDCRPGTHFEYHYLDYCAYKDPIPSISADTFCYSDSTFLMDCSNSQFANSYFYSIEESDQWMNRNPETQKSAWFGNSPGTINTKHFYDSLGGKWKCNTYYRVKLAVANDCNKWVEKVVLIYIHCPASGLAGDDKCCDQLPIYLGGINFTPGNTYQWSPPIYLTSPTSSITQFVPDQSTTYPAKYFLTVTDSNGCTSTDSVTIYCSPTNCSVVYDTNNCVNKVYANCVQKSKIEWKVYDHFPSYTVQHTFTTDTLNFNPEYSHATVRLTVTNPCGNFIDSTIVLNRKLKLFNDTLLLVDDMIRVIDGAPLIIHDLSSDTPGTSHAYHNAVAWRLTIRYVRKQGDIVFDTIGFADSVNGILNGQIRWYPHWYVPDNPRNSNPPQIETGGYIYLIKFKFCEDDDWEIMRYTKIKGDCVKRRFFNKSKCKKYGPPKVVENIDRHDFIIY